MRCPTCRYDVDAWTRQDLRTTAEAAPHLARHVVDGHPDLLPLLAPALAPAADADAVHAAVPALHIAGRARQSARAIARGVVVRPTTAGRGRRSVCGPPRWWTGW